MKTLHNVFLDFLNRDSRQIFGLFANVPKRNHVKLLVEAINISVFLCRDHCILPPGFVAECDIARESIVNRSDFLNERLIRIPLREETWDEFWEKKIREYGPFQKKYLGLYDSKNQKILKKYSGSIIHRTSYIKPLIISAWEKGPDANKIWKPIIQKMAPHEVEFVRKIPQKINDQGTAVTWSAIEEFIGDHREVNPQIFRPILQHDYFSIYLKEFDLKVITNLPFARISFNLSKNSLSYDFEALKAALLPAGLWSIISRMSAWSLISLRRKTGFWDFRETFNNVALNAKSLIEIKYIYAVLGDKLKKVKIETGILEKKYVNPPTVRGYELSEDDIEAVALRLQSFASPSIEIAGNNLESKRVKSTNTLEKKHNMYSDEKPLVAIFVALEMERETLIKRWNLENKYGKSYWEGELNNNIINVFGADEMGRVNAAILTMEYLQNTKPDFLLVAGIAGGFEQEGVRLGDIIVPKSIADLANRKIKQEEENVIPQFRPTEFRSDSRLKRYLTSGSFDKKEWENQVVESEEWPDGLRPTLRYESLASMDEVISSHGWINQLTKAWPKLLGVEMESGGVCAAAEFFKRRAAVIRGISDLADPAKSDNEWRKRAMKTVANLIEHINFQEMLEVDDKN